MTGNTANAYETTMAMTPLAFGQMEDAASLFLSSVNKACCNARCHSISLAGEVARSVVKVYAGASMNDELR